MPTRELILKAANTLREQLELLARLLGQLRESEAAEVNFLLTPGWLRVARGHRRGARAVPRGAARRGRAARRARRQP